MNIYNIQKINKLTKIKHIRNLAIWILHILNKRYLAIYFDPILACNLRCRSCYFSDEEKRKELNGSFKQEDLSRIAEVVFSRALRLQIGCGAEPTLYKYNPELIELAKKYKVPYVSFTTNANLLTEDAIYSLLNAGLDEMTISLHGVRKETYEYLMRNAVFENLLSVLNNITLLKKRFPTFKLRLNYTINNQNLDELTTFFDVFGNFSIDILQLRLLRDIGGDIRKIEQTDNFNVQLNQTLLFVKNECEKRDITYIEPDKSEAEEQKSGDNSAYFYASPKAFWESDFDWKKETFNQYSKRTKYASKLFLNIFK